MAETETEPRGERHWVWSNGTYHDFGPFPGWIVRATIMVPIGWSFAQDEAGIVLKHTTGQTLSAAETIMNARYGDLGFSLATA